MMFHTKYETNKLNEFKHELDYVEDPHQNLSILSSYPIILSILLKSRVCDNILMGSWSSALYMDHVKQFLFPYWNIK